MQFWLVGIDANEEAVCVVDVEHGKSQSIGRKRKSEFSCSDWLSKWGPVWEPQSEVLPHTQSIWGAPVGKWPLDSYLYNFGPWSVKGLPSQQITSFLDFIPSEFFFPGSLCVIIQCCGCRKNYLEKVMSMWFMEYILWSFVLRGKTFKYGQIRKMESVLRKAKDHKCLFDKVNRYSK